MFRQVSKSVAAAAVVVIAIVSPAAAEPTVVEVNPPRGFYVGGEQGSQLALDSVAVPADYQGQDCDVLVVAANGTSVNSGNSLLVSSGADSATVTGVEDNANGTVEEALPMTLGEEVSLALVFGEKGQSSLSFTVDFACSEAEVGAVSESEEETDSETEELTEVEPVSQNQETESNEEEGVVEVLSASGGLLAEIAPAAPAAAHAVAGSPAYTG